MLLISKCTNPYRQPWMYPQPVCLKPSVFSLPLSFLFSLFPDIIQALWGACGQQIVSSNTQWFTTKQFCPSKAVKTHVLYQQRESFDYCGVMCMLVLFSIMVILYWICGQDVCVESCYWKSLVCSAFPKIINPLLCIIIPLSKKNKKVFFFFI